jgi:hypothetical protein
VIGDTKALAERAGGASYGESGGPVIQEEGHICIEPDSRYDRRYERSIGASYGGSGGLPPPQPRKATVA